MSKNFKPKVLSGSDLAGFIKQRQLQQVRRLPLTPKLAIVQTSDNPVIDVYVRLKQEYGEDIGVEVEQYKLDQTKTIDAIEELNDDPDTHGIIVQLPLADTSETDTIVNAVSVEKDVDALADDTIFTSATATAISWILSGYNINLKGQQIAVVGQGRLVGAPLADMFEASGLQVVRCDRTTEDLESVIKESDVVISAVGEPGLIKNDWIQPETVVIDAGTSSDSGEVVGDLEPEIYDRDDLKITPKKGGVGPLTVCALFENVIEATIRQVEKLG